MTDPTAEQTPERRTNYRQLFSFAVCCAMICWIIEYPMQPVFAATNQNTLLVGQNALFENSYAIPLAEPAPFSGKTVEELLRLRLMAVWQQPLLIGINYRPADAVFCRLRSGAAWRDLAGKNGSAGSEYVLNPYLLVAAEIEGDFDTQPWDFRPDSLTWDPAHSRAVAVYQLREYPDGAGQLSDEPISIRDVTLNLVPLNARDMNLNYAAILREDIVGVEPPPGSDKPVLIDQYLRYEPDCGKPGGCNEVSPPQREFRSVNLTDLPARIAIRLWKERPKSAHDAPDMWFTLEFQR